MGKASMVPGSSAVNVDLTGRGALVMIEPEKVAELAASPRTEQASRVTGASPTMDGAATAQW